MSTQFTDASTSRRHQLTASDVSRLERMIEIRLVEDEIQNLFAEGLIPGTTHTSQGQEAVAVGVAAATRTTDVVSCTYRGHGVALSLGVPPERVLGEVLGRQIGCMGGLGGSMHLSEPAVGLLPTFAIVGAGIPIAAGAALQFLTRGLDGVAIGIFGDGTTNIGAFHEGLNLAKVWNLPVVFVCENNLYGEYSPIATTTAVTEIARRATGYDIPSETVDGQDEAAVEDVVARAVSRAREGHGPTLIEAKTYRYVGHSRSDQAPYRPAGELDAWLARDPIELFAAKLVANGVLSETEVAAVRARVADEVARSRALALESPHATTSQMLTNLFASNDPRT